MINNSSIWIGCLPFGRELDEASTVKLLQSLPSQHNYILDLSDIYANGNSLSIIINSFDSLPDNISLSLKLGLTSSCINSFFTVEPRSWKPQELYDSFLQFTNLVPIHRIHSFQLHALPYDLPSISNCIACMNRISNDFSVEIGIANIETHQLLSLNNRLHHLDFIQLHANIIEQKLIQDFTLLEKSSLPSYFIINRVFCRGLLNDFKNIFNNPSSRLNNSKRIKSSLTDERLAILKEIHRLCQENSISVYELSLAFCFVQNISLIPILGGRTLDQFRHSINILDNIDDTLLGLTSTICDTLISLYGESIFTSPPLAFER